MVALTWPMICAVIIIVILWKTVYLNRKRRPIPPLAEGALPIVGHTIVGLYSIYRRKRSYKILTETILGASLKKGNEVVTLRCGTWDVYVFMNPDDSYLLANSCLKKDLVYQFFKPLFGDNGLVTADVPVWQRHRKLINSTFNQTVLDTYLVEFNNLSRLLVKDLAQEAGNGFIDHIPYVKHTILQLVCATIMGVNLEEKDIIEKAGKSCKIISNCIATRMVVFLYHNNFLFSLSNLKKEHYEASRTLQELAYMVLRKKKAEFIAQGNKCNDTSKPRFKAFIDLLLELSEDGSFTDSEIQEEVNTFISAGFDTTSHVIVMTLLILGSYPDVQQKVYEELQEVFKGSDRDVERQDMSKLKYLEAVVKETMRLYPVILGIGRNLDKDLSFRNYTLPAGSRCFISTYNISRHPVWGLDAEQFRPERWLDVSLPINHKAYTVFGLGRRSCIGSNYAMMVIKTVLSHVLRHYRISGDVTQLVQSFNIVVSPISGYHISLECREKDPNDRMYDILV